MTRLETARINEMLDMQIGLIRDLAGHLNSSDIEHLEEEIAEMEKAMRDLKDMVEGLPHRHHLN